VLEIKSELAAETELGDKINVSDKKPATGKKYFNIIENAPKRTAFV
jgi:hypothetical protein